MRYIQYLMIPAAFLAGVLAVSTVQAQTASIQPSFTTKTGYQPAVAGSYTSYTVNSQPHSALADDASYYVKSQAIAPAHGATYAPQVPYAPPTVTTSAIPAAMPTSLHRYPTIEYPTKTGQSPDRTYVQPDGTFLNADGMPVWYVMGEPHVVVVQDTSGLPGYGIPSAAPAGYNSQPFDAENFPAVYAPVGSATHFLEAAYPDGN